MAVNVRGGALEFDAVINGTQFQAQINAIEQSLRNLTNTADKEAQKIDNLMKKTTQAIAAYASFSAASNFVSDIVRVRGEFQQLEVAFNTMLGSKEKADKLMAEVTQFAATTPFELSEVAGATRSLLAFGISADKIKPTLKALGDVSAGVGAPIKEIADLYGKARVQGRLFAEDINQLTGRGIPIIQELAKQFGVADDQVKGLVESGKVGFPQIEQAFKDLTAAGSLFGGLMEAQSKTLTGQLSNLSDAWSQMLNNIGKSNEGIFSGAISAAISLVENYETVLDILKVLILTYGAYKAAVIATTAVQAIQTTITQGYTIAETLRFQAMLLSERAMKLLNATMLSNPAVAVITGITALIATLAIFGKSAVQAKSATELLASAQEKAAESYARQEGKIRPYIEALKSGNLSEQQRLDIYNKLRAIDPDIVKGIDAKALSYDNLKKNVDAYLNSLRQQLAVEANQEAITGSIKEEQNIQDRIKSAQKKLIDLNAQLNKVRPGDTEGRGLLQFSITEQQTNIKALKDQLELQKQVTDELGKQGAEQSKQESESQAVKKRTVDIIEGDIKALKDQRDKVSATSEEYKKFTDQIKKLEKELEAITGKDAAKKSAKDVKDAAKELKDLLKDIAKAEQDAHRSGLTKEETEIDRINARYDELKKRAQEIKAGQGVLQRIENARSEETGNERQQDQFNDYKKFIADQQALFTRFEDYKLDYGEQKAKDLTDFQTGEFSDAIQFLKVQLALVSQDFSFAGKLKKEFLVNAIAQAEKDKVKNDTEKQVAEFKKVAEATITFNIKRKQLETQYQKDLTTLRKQYTGDDLAERESALKESHERELIELEQNEKIKAGIYKDAFKKINESLLFFSREQLKARAKELKDYLKTHADITPEVRKQIIDTINQINDTLKQDSASKQLVQDFQKVSEISFQFAGEVGNIASAFGGLNDDLADILQNISDLSNIAGNAASAVAGFASGNYAAAAGATANVITGVINFFGQAKKSKEQASKDVAQFYDQIAASESNLTLIYRQRERDQVRLNKLKLQGLQDENKLLEEQRKANKKQYDDVLAALQEQEAVIGKGTKKSGGILGIGAKTSATNITESLAGKSFDELEALFLKGQLEGKAKELFETLQKIKDEGVDIDRLLAENAEAAREMFTGTTADSITDSIVEGFQNGLRSAADFADTFEDLMKKALLQSLKMQALEGPLKDFFADFATAAESGNTLSDSEIQALQNNFTNIINNASQKFSELQRITNLDFSSASGSSSAKSLTGAIKGITEQTAELLAGQFGGLRLTALDQLKVASAQLMSLQAIQNHTSRLIRMDENLQWFRQFGIAISK